MLASMTSGQLITRTGHYRWIPVVGMALLACGLMLLSTLSADTDYLVVGAIFLFTGLGLGSIMPVVTTAIQNAAPREMLGAATASSILFRQVGGSLGVFAVRRPVRLAARRQPAGHARRRRFDERDQPANAREAAAGTAWRAVTQGVVAALSPVFQVGGWRCRARACPCPFPEGGAVAPPLIPNQSARALPRSRAAGKLSAARFPAAISAAPAWR